MKLWLLPFTLLCLSALPASAQIYPQPGEGDPRIQTVQYDPAQIIRLSVPPGIQTMVELAAGETIQTIAVGNSAAWTVAAGKRGDFFFVKNASANETTNLTVVTAGRVYNFELSPTSGYGSVGAYHVRVVYRGRSPMTATIEVERQYAYRLSGSKAIRPASVYQEGTRTIIEWQPDAPIPAIFTFENGAEALVNGEMEDGRFVLAGAPQKLIFRMDRQTATAIRRELKVASDE